MKMLLCARADLDNDLSQSAIAQVDKTNLVQTGSELFQGFIARGFLLLNASLIYSDGKVNYHARNWQPFMRHLLKSLAKQNQTIQLILLGRIAKQVPEAAIFPKLVAEHPYNISFITNQEVLEFFKPMDLLAKNDQNNNSR
jgi:uracil-DNA glycosylase